MNEVLVHCTLDMNPFAITQFFKGTSFLTAKVADELLWSSVSDGWARSTKPGTLGNSSDSVTILMNGNFTTYSMKIVNKKMNHHRRRFGCCLQMFLLDKWDNHFHQHLPTEPHAQWYQLGFQTNRIRIQNSFELLLPKMPLFHICPWDVQKHLHWWTLGLEFQWAKLRPRCLIHILQVDVLNQSRWDLGLGKLKDEWNN